MTFETMDVQEAPLTASTNSRSASPDSQLANSLHQATATIEDITVALSNYSRVQTPEAPYLQRCCCLRDDCEHTKAWLSFKAKLEHRLLLSAEVGHALLKKYETFLRRYQASYAENPEPGRRSPTIDESSVMDMDFSMERRVASLLEENAKLEKQLNSALLNSEVIESENKILNRDLQEAKNNITRLSTIQAKTLGLDVRLTAALQDVEDLRQELENETNKANMAESRLSALTVKYSAIKYELRRCIEELEQQKLSRSQLSEEILRDARARLEMLQQTQLGHSLVTGDTEVLKIMESLVTDNEDMKRNTAELQNLLAESRDDVRTLREENDELRASSSSAPDSSQITRPSRHRHSNSSHSFFPLSPDRMVPVSPRFSSSAFHRFPSPSRVSDKRGRTGSRGRSRPSSLGPSGQNAYEPLTPETQLRPLSPAGSSLVNEPHSYVTNEADDAILHIATPDSVRKSKIRQSFSSLKHSRGVQTDDWLGYLGLSYQASPAANASSIPPSDGRSESSSLVDPQSSTIASLIDRINTLFTRISQADALTLMNRLKRQHLPGDVGHLSRSTINSIVAEIANLRSVFRAILEDEKAPCTCSRKDLRGLLRLFKDIFSEFGEIRVTLNEVIMNPSIATRVSQMALEPSKAASDERGRSATGGVGSMGSWIAPISKLFGSSSGQSQSSTPTKSVDAPSVLPPRSATPGRILHRPIPRSGPALGASNATVNVEFSSGRAMTIATSTAASSSGSTNQELEQEHHQQGLMALPNQSRHFLDIFAGAPQVSQEDHWVVLPDNSPQRNIKRNVAPSAFRPSMPVTMRSSKRLSRNVDAIIDSPTTTSVEASGDGYGVTLDEDSSGQEVGNLLQRTLRPRGLSDSSIRSTFLSHAGDTSSSAALPPHALLSSGSSGRQGPYLDRQSVLRSLGHRIQNFKSSSSPQPQAEASSSIDDQIQRAVSPSKGIDINILPNFASWAAAKAGLDPVSANQFVRSFKDESAFPNGPRKWKRNDLDF